jgi:tetratricopeptide (TPR) repeat protein
VRVMRAEFEWSRARAALACALALLAVNLGGPHRAAASEASERLYSRGLVELHADRPRKSLTFFDRAVAADPNDPYALYYRGVARGRAGDREGAITDLRAALAIQPGLSQASADLGMLLVESGRYEEALPYLEGAEAVGPTGDRAALLRGVALLRLRRMEEARASFIRAERDPAIAPTARYYQGVTAYQLQDWAAAETHFRSVAETQTDSEIGREAQRYLDSMGTQRVRPYKLYAEAGFQYDSNVCLLPDDGTSSCGAFGSGGNEQDGRAVFTLGGLYAPILTDRGYIAVGYEFFQSLHFDLNEFDLQDHRPSLQAAVIRGPVLFGVYGRYDYYLRDTHSSLQEGNVIPWLTVRQGNFGRIELFYRMRERDFRDDDFQHRDGFNHSTGGAQYVYLGSDERWVGVGYRFDAENPLSNDAPSKQFSYDGNEVNTHVRWLWPRDISTFLGYAFRYEQYDGKSTVVNNQNSFRRRDKEHHVTFLAEVPINRYIGVEPYIAVALGYFGTFNNSNKNDPFEYTRNIASLSLRAAY